MWEYYFSRAASQVIASGILSGRRAVKTAIMSLLPVKSLFLAGDLVLHWDGVSGRKKA